MGDGPLGGISKATEPLVPVMNSALVEDLYLEVIFILFLLYNTQFFNQWCGFANFRYIVKFSLFQLFSFT